MTEENDSLKKRRNVAPGPGAPFNDVEKAIYERRSARYYKKKQVPEHLVRRVLEAARFAPSAGNAQPWKFIVVQDPKLIDEMTEEVTNVCKRVMKFADYLDPGKEKKRIVANFLMKTMPNMFHPTPFGAMKLIAEGKLGLWHGAPTVIAIMVDKRAPGIPALDAGIAGQNLALAAESLGLATCWVSFIKPLGMIPKWKKRLGIRYPYQLVTSIALGYPKGDPSGMVSRETQAIDWYTENGAMKVVY